MENLAACLPPDLQGATITRIAAGLSGAGVYRVGDAFVLKIAAEPLDDWRRKLRILQLAADAGVAPRIVHTDEARRAVLSELVADRSFFGFLMTSRDAALALLGRTVRRVHDIPLPSDVTPRDARGLLATTTAALAGFAVPAFVHEATQRMLAATPPGDDRPPVLGHNDINPTNLIYDGERIVLLDWETAGANDRWYDLAALAVFLRLDEASCRALLAAYDGTTELPERFRHDRRLIAAMCGAMFLHLAQRQGHPGDASATPLSLIDFYQRLRTGALSPATAEGQWQFGLALAARSLEL